MHYRDLMKKGLVYALAGSMMIGAVGTHGVSIKAEEVKNGTENSGAGVVEGTQQTTKSKKEYDSYLTQVLKACQDYNGNYVRAPKSEDFSGEYFFTESKSKTLNGVTWYYVRHSRSMGQSYITDLRTDYVPENIKSLEIPSKIDDALVISLGEINNNQIKSVTIPEDVMFIDKSFS